MAKKETIPLPSRIKLAGLGKRTLAVILDAVFFTALTFALYYAIGIPAILNNNAYYPTLKAEASYVRRTNLFVESETTEGSFSYTVYTDAEDVKTTGDYAYLKYIDLLWGYFMDFIPANNDMYSVNFTFTLTSTESASTAYTDVPKATDQAYGKWVYTNFFGYADSSDPTNLPFFVPSVENDFTSKPKTTKDPAEYYVALRKAMYNPDEIKGHYIDAGLQLDNQPVLANYRNMVNFAFWAARLPALLGADFILFILLPLLIPGGKTLGKLICNVALVGKDGYTASKLNIALRQFVLFLIWGVLALPWAVIVVPLFFLLIILDYVFIVMTDRHTGLQDMIASTLAIDGKKSVWFSSKEDEDDFIEQHPQSPIAKKRAEEEEKKSPAYLAAEARLEAEEAILDLSTINKRREEARRMTSFDEFEKEKDADFEAKKEQPVVDEPEEKDLTVEELAEMEGISVEEAKEMLGEEPEEDGDGFTDK